VILARGPIVDLLDDGDECVVLLERQCLRLSSVAAAVIELLELPRPADEVRARVQALFGTAPRGRFESLIEDLVQQGVVVRAHAVRSEDP
jgi:hypothetical protein